MRIDLHVHASELSPCGKSTADEMVRAARAAGLDALVFTHHNRFVPETELVELNRRHAPFRIFGGIEVNVEEEHVLVLGVRDPSLEEPGWSWPALHDFVRARAGFLVLAHPYRYRLDIRLDLDRCRPDAVELYSVNTPVDVADRIRALARRHGLRLLCDSDAHKAEDIGKHYNEFAVPLSGEAELLAALRAGAYQPRWQAEELIPMEVDAALEAEEKRLRAADFGAYLWEPAAPAVVMGVGGHAEREVRAEALARDGVALLQRRSGGGTVFLAPGVLGFGLVLPGRGSLCAPSRLARELLPALRNGLERLGLDAGIAGLGDLAVANRKICGTAQRWTRSAILFHGALLVDLDTALLDRYLPHPPREPEYRRGRPHGDFCATLAELAGKPLSCRSVAGLLAGELSALAGRPAVWLESGLPVPAGLAAAPSNP